MCGVKSHLYLPVYINKNDSKGETAEIYLSACPFH